MDIFDTAIESGFSVHTKENVIWFTPVYAEYNVFLKLRSITEGKFKLVEHRNPTLTRKYQGESVDSDWVIRFLRANSSRAKAVKTITFDNIPSNYVVIKKTDVKAVIRAPDDKVLTVWKEGDPSLEETRYGSQTRNWERNESRVTNWHYNKRRQ
jgi:hypothetical protein